MTPKKEFERIVKRDVEARVREGVKAVLEEVLQEEMTEHLEAGYRELTPPGAASETAATPVTSSLPQARSSVWRFRATGKASSLRSSSSDTSA